MTSITGLISDTFEPNRIIRMRVGVDVIIKERRFSAFLMPGEICVGCSLTIDIIEVFSKIEAVAGDSVTLCSGGVNLCTLTINSVVENPF